MFFALTLHWLFWKFYADPHAEMETWVNKPAAFHFIMYSTISIQCDNFQAHVEKVGDMRNS